MGQQDFIEAIREKLHGLFYLDGWLVYDYQGKNRYILDLFGVPRDVCPTRRFFYFLPRRGPSVTFVHKVDEHIAEYFPGTLELYGSWKELSGRLFAHLQGKGTLAMEDWSSELLPAMSILDAPTKKWLEDNGKSIVSSWPLIEKFVAPLLPHQKNLLTKAGAILDKAFLSAWQLVKKRLAEKHPLSEIELQEYIVRIIRGEGGTSLGKPIVAAGKNSALPHHEPTQTLIQPDEVVLIDAWCKKDELEAPYADFTQVAFTGKKATTLVENAFQVVRSAQKQAIGFIETCRKENCSITGAEVDDACRSIIDGSHFRGSFIHRTGHNVFLDVHGPGAHLDNFETHDTRHLIERGCYTIEPGVYLEDEFGIRLECMVLMEPDGKISLFNEAPQTIQCLA